jgi:hypothetical protein
MRWIAAVHKKPSLFLAQLTARGAIMTNNALARQAILSGYIRIICRKD